MENCCTTNCGALIINPFLFCTQLRLKCNLHRSVVLPAQKWFKKMLRHKLFCSEYLDTYIWTVDMMCIIMYMYVRAYIVVVRTCALVPISVYTYVHDL